MHRLFYGFLAATAALLVFSCQKPEEFAAERSSDALVTFTARFMYDDSDDNEFKGEIDHANHTITVVFPYNYPVLSDNVLTQDMLSHIRVQATTENNVIVSPSLLFMDMTKDNVITVTDNLARTKTEYTVRAEIRKSAECSISSFQFGDLGVTGVISAETHEISIVSIDLIGSRLAEVTLSHGATISPDPRTEALDWDGIQTLTVTAQNGVDKNVYTVKKSVPDKFASGIRPGSGVLKWTRKLSTIPGVTDPKTVHGFAITPSGIVINQQGATSLPVIKALDGSDTETSVTVPSGSNYFMTSDDAGNILTSIYMTSKPAGSQFVIRKVSSAGSEVLVDYTDPDANSLLGWKFSVQGSVDDDALITSLCVHGGAASLAIWQIRDGALLNNTPEYVATGYTTANYARWSDVVAGGTAAGADYFIVSYARISDNRYINWFDGATNGIKAQSLLWNNSVLQTIDYEVFNGAPYLVYSNCNTFTWAVNQTDWILMNDLSTGTIENRIEVIEPRKWGGQPAGTPNSNGFSDVLLVPSSNGFYLNVYFIFAGGYVGCVQYDCFEN